MAQRWQDVLDQLNGGDMPPQEAKQPSNDELAMALEDARLDLEDADIALQEAVFTSPLLDIWFRDREH